MFTCEGSSIKYSTIISPSFFPSITVSSSIPTHPACFLACLAAITIISVFRTTFDTKFLGDSHIATWLRVGVYFLSIFFIFSKELKPFIFLSFRFVFWLVLFRYETSQLWLCADPPTNWPSPRLPCTCKRFEPAFLTAWGCRNLDKLFCFFATSSPSHHSRRSLNSFLDNLSLWQWEASFNLPFGDLWLYWKEKTSRN